MRLTPAEDVVAILRTSVRVLAVGMDGVSDDDVEVEGSVEEPLEGGEEEVVKTHGERVAQQLQADEDENLPYYRPIINSRTPFHFTNIVFGNICQCHV